MFRLLFVTCLSVLSLLTFPADAQGLGEKPIKLVVGFTPGSGADTTSRMIATKLSAVMGKNVIVENKPGAASMLAAEYLGNNGADPAMIMYATGSIITSYLTNPNMKIDVMEDLKPLMHLGDSQLILLINKNLPVKNYQETLALFRASPGKYNYGSTGVGGATHMFMEEFLNSENIKLTHIPYKGTGQAFNALLAGEIDAMFATQSVAGASIRAGTVLGAAVSGNRRAALLDQIPTFKEAGNPTFNSTLLSGYFINAKVDPAVVDEFNRALNQVIAMPDVRSRLEANDMIVAGGTSEDFKSELLEEIRKQKAILEYVTIQ